MAKSKLLISLIILLIVVAIIVFIFFFVKKEKGSEIYSEPGLVAYWKFNEGTGCSVFDSSGNNNQAILKPDCPSNSPQRVLIEENNFTLQFDGKDDYLEVPEAANLDITQKITLQALIKYSADPKSFNGIILAKYDKDFDLPFYLLSGPVANGISFAIRDNFGMEHSAKFSFDKLGDWQNNWFKIVGIFDGEKLKIYVDGKEGEIVEFKGEIKSKKQGIRIGARNENDLAFQGLIDEVKIYNTAISQ